MIVPTVKTLITYMKDDETIKVLSDIKMGDDKYASIEYEHDIMARCPFDDSKYHEEIHQVRDNIYEIVHYDYVEPMYKIDVVVNHVLEFDGKIFLLKEIDYDMKEFED